MTQVIDERVVEMKFDNEQFEKNVAQSMSTLQKLKNALNFDSAKSLQELGSVTKNFDMSHALTSVEGLSSKFSALEVIGVTALVKITNAAMDMGTKLVKSLTLDQVSAGFTKYADKTTAVQTIMAATANQFSDQATQMKYINEQMDKLMWFTDETSYNFVDMVSNIGKFTSNNIDLETSVTAMEGIANWAAISGQNATTASRAMYNFAQAMGVGAMKVQDWKSIENANMATYQFKQTAIETAAELGKLKKVADGVYQTLDGKGTVTAESFRDELKRGWFDKDVMLKTLEVYGGFTDKLHDLAEQSGLTATELLDASEKIAKGQKLDASIFEASTMSAEELTAALTELNGEQYKTGQQAFRNAQEAKTFLEVIDALKDAVSTKWSQTFELIFGDYLEAKKLWTGLVNDLYEVFAAGGDERNEILGFWKELGGRTELIKGIISMVNLLVKPIQTIHNAFKDMFPDTERMGEILYDLTVRFREFMDELQPSEEALKDIYIIFHSLFTIGKLVSQVIVNVIHAILPVTMPLKNMFEIIVHILAVVASVSAAIAEFISENNLLAGAVTFIVSLFGTLLNVLKTVAMIVGGGIFAAIAGIATVLIKAGTAVRNFFTQVKPLTKIMNTLEKGVSKVTSLFSRFSGTTEKATTKVVKMKKNYAAANEVIAQTGTLTRETTAEVKKSTSVLEKVANVVKTVVTVIGAAILTVINGFKKLATTVIDFFKNIGTYWNKVTNGATTLKDKLAAFFGSFGEKLQEVKEKIIELLESLGVNTDEVQEGFGKLRDIIGDFISKITPGKVVALAFAAALIGIAGAAVKLSGTLTDTLSAAKGLFFSINKLINKQFAKATIFTDIAKAFVLISASLIALAYVDKNYGPNLEHVAKIMGTMIVIAGAFAVVLTLLSGAFAKKNVVEGFQTNITMLIAMAGAVGVLALALAALNQINIKGNWKDWAAKLGLMAALLLEIGALAVILAKLAPVLTKGSVMLLTIALSFKFIADSLAKIANLPDLNKISDSIWQFGVIFAGIGAIIFAAGNLRLTSALSILLVAKAIQMIFPELVKVAHMITAARFDEMASHFEKHLRGTAALVGLMGGVGWLIYAVGNLGKLFVGIASSVIAVSVGVAILINSIKEIEQLMNVMTPEQMTTALRVCGGFVLLLSGVMLLIGAFDKIGQVVSKKFFGVDILPMKFASLGLAMLALSTSILIMVGALDIISEINQPIEKIQGLALILGGLTLAFGAAIGLASLAGRAKGTTGAITAMMIALGSIVAEVIVLALMIERNGESVFWAIVSLTSIMVVLGGVFVAMGKIGYKKTGPIIAFTVMLGLLAGAVVAIAALTDIIGADNLKLAALILAGIAAVVVIITALITKVFSKGLTPAKIRNITQILKLMREVCEMLSVMCLVVVGLVGISMAAGGVGMLWSAVGILTALGAIISAMTALILYKFAKITPTQLAKVQPIIKAMKTICHLLGVLALAVIALTITSRLAGAGHIWSSVGVITALGAVVSAITWFLSKVLTKTAVNGDKVERVLETFRTVCWMLTLLAVDVAALGAIAKVIGIDNIALAATVVGVLTIVIAGITTGLVFLAKATKNWSNTLQMLATFGSIVAALVVVSGLIYGLAKLDQNVLRQAAETMGGLLVTIGVLAVVLGAISAVVAKFTGGAGLGGMGLTIGLIAALAGALVASAYAFQIGAGAIETFAHGLEALIPPLEQLSIKDLLKLAGALVAIGMGVTVLGAAGLVGGMGIGVLAVVLSEMVGILPTIIPMLEQLQEIDFVGLAGGFVSLGLSGLVLAIGAAGVSVFADALVHLCEAMSVAKDLDTFWEDVERQFDVSRISSVIKAAEKAGKAIAGDKHTGEGFIGGFAKKLGWGCPIEDLITFNKDVGEQLENNEQAVLGAKRGGEKTAMSWLDGFGEWLAKGSDAITDIAGSLGESFTGLFNFDKSDTEAGAKGFGDQLGTWIGVDAVNTVSSIFSTAFPSMAAGLSGMFSGLFSKYQNVNPMVEKTTDNINLLKNATEKGTQTTREFSKSQADLRAQMDLHGKGLTQATSLTEMFGNATSKTFDKVKEKIGEGADSADYLIDKVMESGEEFVKGATGANDWGDAVSGAAGKAGSAVKDFASTLKDTLSGQMDIFSKFEFKTGISADTMLENMRSQLDGFASWSHRLAVLAERGIDQALYQKLAEMGPKGYETLNAFVEMTDEQLQEANQLFTASLAMPAKAADVVGQGYAYAGEMAALGWSNALQQHMAEHAASMQAARKEVADFNAGLGVASPSTEFFQSAIFCLAGFKMGITDPPYLAVVEGAIRWTTCAMIINAFREELSPERFADFGRNAMAGLAAGLEEGGQGAIATTETIINTINSLIEGKKGFDNGSPSKRLRKDGKFAMAGLRIGIVEAGQTVINAAQMVTDGTIEAFSPFGKIQDLINTSMDFNPIITPMLDLSYIRSQVSELDGMLNPEPIDATVDQNGGQRAGGNTITFTQNNYSPKALSRIEIYRQTKNQISMLKGAMLR